jgi:hypothetical protein
MDFSLTRILGTYYIPSLYGVGFLLLTVDKVHGRIFTSTMKIKGHFHSRLIPHVQVYIWGISGLSIFHMLRFLTEDHLMVEKTNALLNERNAELLSRLEYHRIILTATWRSNVLRT